MPEASWWKRSVLYEVLVPSFRDSKGDGWGDLAGIGQRLDYLADLGAGALWLSPFYRSAFYDIGYDIIDHTAVDPRFGTLEDFDNLLAQAHARDLRVVIDFVPNHTSRHHEWFLQARSSRGDPKRDWYLWADPAPRGGPPNNWINRFGRSAWSYDEATGQYFLGSFTQEQPDLNWRNPEVRRALLDILRFWLERGVDGVRVDALPHLIKDRYLRDNPVDPGYSEDKEPMNRLYQAYSQNQPELPEALGLLRGVIEEYGERVLIGEAYQSPEQLAAYQRAGVHLFPDTSMLQTNFDATSLRFMIDYVEGLTPPGAWPARGSGNHDLPRLAERAGRANLRLATLLLFTTRGTPTLYYGDELGLENIRVPRERMQDPSGREDPRYCRDGARVPMPWHRPPGGLPDEPGPWLPMTRETMERNVDEQLAAPDSLLNFHRRLLQIRAAEPDLQTGRHTPLETPAPVLALRRGEPPEGLLIALNISDEPAVLQVPGIEARVILSTIDPRQTSPFHTRWDLQPREGIIARIVDQEERTQEEQGE